MTISSSPAQYLNLRDRTIMFISKLNLLTKVKTYQADSKIALKPFIDLYFDTSGWYALGHYEPEAFLAAVVKQDPYTEFSTAQVQLTWAKFDGNDLEITKFPIDGSQAITFIEDHGILSV